METKTEIDQLNYRNEKEERAKILKRYNTEDYEIRKFVEAAKSSHTTNTVQQIEHQRTSVEMPNRDHTQNIKGEKSGSKENFKEEMSVRHHSLNPPPKKLYGSIRDLSMKYKEQPVKENKVQQRPRRRRKWLSEERLVRPHSNPTAKDIEETTKEFCVNYTEQSNSDNNTYPT